jgi:hypothetical protein
MSRTAHFCWRAIAFCALVLALPAHARIGLVIGEPYGSFGTMLPVGHAAIYLDHVCAASPTQLRPCNPGEAGVVLARYHDLRVRDLDWMAIPAFTFFYGVDSPAQIPAYVTPKLEAELRESYRQDHLLDIVPDHMDKHGKLRPPRNGDWKEGIGAAFDRRLLIYSIDTTPQQDAALLAMLNAAPNRRRYTLARANCADFAAGLLSVVIPGVLHRNFLADFDMTTPKNLARQLDDYGRSHAELGLRVYEVPQLAGTLRRSRPLRGAAETFVKTKRYLTTLIVLQPEAVLADWIVYETKGKWTPGRDAAELSPASWPSLTAPAAIQPDYSSLASDPSTFSDASTLRAK